MTDNIFSLNTIKTPVPDFSISKLGNIYIYNQNDSLNMKSELPRSDGRSFEIKLQNASDHSVIKESEENKEKKKSKEQKLDFSDSLKIRRTLTEQLCEEISMKLGNIYLWKSYLQTYIYELSPYIMNFSFSKDDLSAAKNRVLNSVMLSSFTDLVWNGYIYKHEYLLSKNILSKYKNAIQRNPDSSEYCIIPIFSLDNIKKVLTEQEEQLKILKRNTVFIKKNNDNLLFILNIIKNNFEEIKLKAQRIVQRLLLRMIVLDKLYMLRKNADIFSNKYEQHKMRLVEMLQIFNAFNVDHKIREIHKNISKMMKLNKETHQEISLDREFCNSLNEKLYQNEQDITNIKSVTSEIYMNVEENKEQLYESNYYNLFEIEDISNPF